MPGFREHQAVVERGHEEHDDEAPAVYREADDPDGLAASGGSYNKEDEGDNGQYGAQTVGDTICDFLGSR